MAYSNSGLKYCRKVLDFGGQLGGAIWILDTVDAQATVYAAGYISDGNLLGFRKGDIVIARRWTTTLPTTDAELKTAAATANVLISVFIHFVIGISTTGLPDLTDGLAITATNT
ncbi:MAG: hypothetical protein EBR82_08030 [Caulobacteraceae bacterium]|nr:hypothetical protein [Caulobacteraceae bacterium]